MDADTILHVESLRRLVSRLECSPSDTMAIAGTVLVRNSRENLLTRMQEWDYYLGIAAVKQMQGLYQATLVAQGAFSLFLTEEVRRVGGWPDAIGEDIVMSWRLMQAGDRVLFEPTAVAFTDAPVKLRHFMRQRARWARGTVSQGRNNSPCANAATFHGSNQTWPAGRSDRRDVGDRRTCDGPGQRHESGPGS